MDNGHRFIFEHFAGTQARDRDVLHSIIAVRPEHVVPACAEILYRIVSCFDYAAILFDDVNMGNLCPFVGGIVANLKLY